MQIKRMGFGKRTSIYECTIVISIWLLHVSIGFAIHQVGFSIKKNGAQNITESGKTPVGPWNTAPSNDPRFYVTDVNFDRRLFPIAPHSGIYFFNLKIYLENTLPGVQYAIRVTSSSSSHSLSAWTNDYEIESELSLSGCLRLTVGEKIFVTFYAEIADLIISEKSAFSMQIVGEIGVLPSFLARSAKDDKFGPNRIIQIPNWKVYHKSLSSFSAAEGIFVPVLSTNYICSLNLVLQQASGIFEIVFQTDNRILLTLKKHFKDRVKITTIHISKIFALQKNEIFRPTVQGLNSSFIISRATTFSCALAGEEEKAETLQIRSPVDINLPSDRLQEVHHWKEIQTSSSFSFLAKEGKIFFPESLIFFSLSLRITASKRNVLDVFVTPEGAPNKIGIVKSLRLKQSVPETVSFTGFIKEVRYISVFLSSKHDSIIRISNGELKTILKEPLVPSILSPFLNSSAKLNLNQSAALNWQILRIDKSFEKRHFVTESPYWRITDDDFSPKEKGLYYIAVVLQLFANNASHQIGSSIEAKIAVKRDKDDKQEDLLYVFRDINQNEASLNLAGVYFLQPNDKVYVAHKCFECEVSKSSGFSALWISKSFKSEGFSTLFVKNKNVSFSTEIRLDGWSRDFAKFLLTNSFNAVKGMYEAPYDGVFLVSCTILARNVSKNSRINLLIDVANTSNSYMEEFVPSSRNGEMQSLSVMMPIQLRQGQTVSLKLSATNNPNAAERHLHKLVINKESKFAIVALVDSRSSSPPGFTVSLSNQLYSWRSYLPLIGWTSDDFTGAFSHKSKSLYEFNKAQGELIVRKSAVLLLNIVAHIKTARKALFTLYVRINEEFVKRVLMVTNELSSKGDDDPLKISVVLLVENKDRITVGVKPSSTRGNNFNVLKKTVMSAVFLSDIPTKPGMMLGVQPYSPSQKRGKKTFRYILKNDCAGCYQDNILYDESDGNFQIPFAGIYLISMNLNFLAQSPLGNSDCGMYSDTEGQFLTSKTIERSGHYELAEIVEFFRPSNFTFACISDNQTLELGKQNFLSITLLQFKKAIVTSVTSTRTTESQYSKCCRSQLEYTVMKERPYLVVISATNNTLHNFTLFVKDEKKRRDVDAIVPYEMSPSLETALYVVVYLKEDSRLTLEWQEGAGYYDKNATTLYEIQPSSAGVSLEVEEDCFMEATNKTFHAIRNWEVIPDFQNTLEFDFGKGTFISKQPAEYLVVANIRTVAKRRGKRSVFLSINDGLEKDSFSVPLCSTHDDNSCRTSFITTIQLQKWQSLGIYVDLANVNDTLTILQGSRWSLLLLERRIPTYEDSGPIFVQQPWPVYTNISRVFDWQCEAVGSQNVTYTWNWISRETKVKKIAGYGKKLTIFGRPEESGYYFCSADMNGTVHNSRIATLDISDTDECNQNITEQVEELCHKDAYCINTIGSYLCRCNTGFKGDGFKHCEDINECGFNGTCHIDATCTNTIGSYTCRCNEGFEGNGTMCKDINECQGSNSCAKDANCINSIGSYSCACKVGYSGNGYECSNINECNYEENPCHKEAFCSDTVGSFDCTCRSGWTGNGTVCEDINECLFTNCTGNATCHNQPGSYRCKCKPGFKGDGFTYCESLGCTPPPFCTGEFKAAWWARSPYLANSSDQEPSGLFKDLLTQVITECCNNCSLLSFVGPFNDSREVEAQVEGNKTVDFGCPLYGSPDQTLFKGQPYMPIVESPGIAFFIKDQPRQSSALLDSLGSTWPILAITFLLACLSGVIIWFLDTTRNPVEFPNSFLEGSWEGFWWAFITMTTVGYGDKAPRSFPARVFGIVWILVGLVIISTFTATITTMLTASSLSDETKLYGTRVGVLDNSEEYRLGVKRNAEAKAYKSVEEIVGKIDEGEVQGILLDTYIAGEFQDKLHALRLQQVIDYTFSYGVALSRDGLALRSCFQRFLESKQSQIYATISKVIKPLKTKGGQNLAAEKSANIFDADSVYFKYIVYIGLGTFACLFLIGLIWECINSRRRKTEYSLTSTSEEKEPEMMEWRVQWESGKVSHFQHNIFKNDIGDLKQQIKDFADSWVRRLEELERRQAKEVVAMRMNENKKHNGHGKHHQGLGRLFSVFKRDRKYSNGNIQNATTAL